MMPFACKKGENDPLFSLLPRKTRLTGTWQMTNSQYSIGDTVYNYADDSLNISITDTSYTIFYTEIIDIKKDGTFEKSVNTNGQVVRTMGTWVFGKKNNTLGFKNKEYVLFTITSIYRFVGTISYEGTACPVHIWAIDKLKNRNMDIIHQGSHSNGYGYNKLTGLKQYQKM